MDEGIVPGEPVVDPSTRNIDPDVTDENRELINQDEAVEVPFSLTMDRVNNDSGRNKVMFAGVAAAVVLSVAAIGVPAVGINTKPRSLRLRSPDRNRLIKHQPQPLLRLDNQVETFLPVLKPHLQQVHRQTMRHWLQDAKRKPEIGSDSAPIKLSLCGSKSACSCQTGAQKQLQRWSQSRLHMTKTDESLKLRAVTAWPSESRDRSASQPARLAAPLFQYP